MVRIFPIDELSQRKKILLAQSDLQRQLLRYQLATLQGTAGNIKRRFSVAALSTVAFSAAISLMKNFFARKKAESSGKKGIFGKIISGIGMLNEARKIFSQMKQPPGDQA